MGDDRRTALLQEYGEVRDDFRTLAGIRFQLLAFLPLAAGAAAALGRDAQGVPEFSLSLFGLVITVALVTYNERNNQLYNELVARAAVIERSLGLPDGAFANRPGAWLAFGYGKYRWKVEHGFAINLIYAASATLWVFGVLSPLLAWTKTSWLPTVPPGFFRESVAVTNRGISFLAALSLVALAWGYIAWRKGKREDIMRILARKLARRVFDEGLDTLKKDLHFLSDCAQLSGQTEKRIASKVDYYREQLGSANATYYLCQSTPRFRAAHTLALLTDLPPQWIYDWLTNRQGLLDEEPTPAKESTA